MLTSAKSINENKWTVSWLVRVVFDKPQKATPWPMTTKTNNGGHSHGQTKQKINFLLLFLK